MFLVRQEQGWPALRRRPGLRLAHHNAHQPAGAFGRYSQSKLL